MQIWKWLRTSLGIINNHICIIPAGVFTHLSNFNFYCISQNMDESKSPYKFNNDLILKLIISPKFRLFRHLILLVLLGTGFINGRVNFPEPVNTYVNISHFVLLLFVVYANMYLFVPKLLFKDKYLGYFLCLVVMFFFVQAISTTGMHLVLKHFKPRIEPLDDYSSRFFFTFMFFILMGASAAVKLFQRWVTDSQRINELETNTIYTELENLKKQINPHFLFNTLNNVNVLTQKDPEKASQIIMKLSDLLRYQLYDSVRNLVLLSAEIHFLEDFLNLEKIRRDHFEFSINQKGAISGIEVPPLLFITFIENAVKYNIDAENPSFVDLFIAVSEQQLIFHCMNSKPSVKVESNKQGGLGLANVKRRLELLYPDKHTLSIQDNHNRYNVELTIKL